MFRHAHRPRPTSELLESRRLLSGQVQLLKDLNTVPRFRSNPQLVEMGERMYFENSDGIHGNELFSTDGTADGTTLLKDLLPGPASSQIQSMTVTGSKFFFVRSNPDDSDSMLWVSDGTNAGTIPVKPVSGRLVYYPSASGGLLYYLDTGGLWRSDGTAAGTFLVKSWDFDFSHTYWFEDVNGTLFFSGPDPSVSGGTELWKSDGTPEGTTLVADGTPTTSSNPQGLLNLNGVLYFRASDAQGPAIYRSDGTAAGTVRVRSFQAAGAPLAILNGEVYFSASDPNVGSGLWKTDGTAAGTEFVSAVTVNSDAFNSGDTASVGGLLYFIGSDSSFGAELWRTDGTSAGTFRLTDIRPGSLGSSIQNMAGVGSTMYFVGDDGANHRQIWRSNGTPGGTSLVFQLDQGPNLSVSPNLLSFDDQLYFSGYTLAAGSEIYTSDGTTSGTHVVRDLDPGTESSTPIRYTSVNGRTVFVAGDGQLWVTDGTAPGTVPLNNGVAAGSDLTNAGDVVYFTGWDAAHGAELWQTDGTPQGTHLTLDLVPGPDGESSMMFAVIGQSIYLATRQSQTQSAVWRIDRTTADATLLRLFTINFTSGLPGGFTGLGNSVFFAANDGSSGTELWKTDGTAAGTVLVKDILPGTGSSSPAGFIPYNGRLYFSAIGIGLGRELWSTDGTSSGTILLKDINPGTATGIVAAPRLFNGLLYFSATDPAHAVALWKSDGTTAGTVPIQTVAPDQGALTSPSGRIYFSGDRLYIIGMDAAHGRELWVSDGSTEGTHLLYDINPGPASSLNNLSVAVAGNGRIFIRADDGVHGAEVWTSDGTAAGTHLLADINPDPLTEEWDLALADNRLFITQNDGVHGEEPWIMDLPFAAISNRTLSIGGTSAADQASVSPAGNGDVTVTLNGQSLTFASSDFDAVLFSGGAGDDSLSIGAIGATKAIRVNGGLGADALHLTAGAHNFDEDLNGWGDKIALHVAAGATVAFGATQHLAALDVAGLATLAAGGTRRIVTESLAVSGALDLADNALILDYSGASQLAAVQQLINAARAGGTWTGSTGLTSSAARDNALHNTTLGAMEATDYKSLYGANATFNGEPLDDTAVLVKYTYYGDTDFNGTVNFDDYVRTDNGFNNHLTGWLNGDFDANGVVNFDDYVLIDLAFNTQGAAMRKTVPGLALAR